MTYRITEKIFLNGVKTFDVYNNLYGRDIEYYKNLALLMSNLKKSKLGFQYIFFTNLELPKDGQERSTLLDSFKSELQKLNNCDIFIVFQRKEIEGDKWRYVVKTRSKFTDLTRFHIAIGGGGHKVAGGGFVIAKDDVEVLAKVEDVFSKTIL